MKWPRLPIALAGFVLLATPLLAVMDFVAEPEYALVLPRESAAPELDAIATAAPGETMYYEVRDFDHSVAVLEAPYHLKKIELPAGSVLYGYRGPWRGGTLRHPGPETWCSHEVRQGVEAFCLIDEDGDGRLDVRTVGRGIFGGVSDFGPIEGRWFRELGKSHPPVPYYRAVRPFDETFHHRPPDGHFRIEVVSRGFAEGVITLEYRGPEAPAVVLMYAFDEGGPTLVRCREALIEILSADRGEVHYRVRSGFGERSRPELKLPAGAYPEYDPTRGRTSGSVWAGPPRIVLGEAAEPPLGVETEARPGEAIYTMYGTVLQEAVTIEPGFRGDDVNLEPGHVLWGYWLDPESPNRRPYAGRVAWCSHLAYFPPPKRTTLELPFCMLDVDGDGRLDMRSRVYPHQRPPTLQWVRLGEGVAPIAYSVEVRPFDWERQRFFGLGGERWRREILFQGVVDGRLRLVYREFSHDPMHPDYFQQAAFRLSESGPTTISFDAVGLEVLAAGNEGIRYRLLSGLPSSAYEEPLGQR